MRKKTSKILYLSSAVSFFLLAVSVLLFYPSSYLFLNKGSRVLRYIAGILFWVSACSGIILQVVSRIMYGKLPKSNNTDGIKSVLLRTPLSLIMAAIALIGVVGSAISMAITMNSTLHTFFFLAFAVLGITEYLVFNSRYFTNFMKRSDESDK